MELCSTSITLWLLSGTQVSSCTLSQVVTPCRIPSTRESHRTQQTPRRKLSRTVLCSWRGDCYARRLAENGSNVLCRIVWPAKVHLFECRQIQDLHKEERQTTTREVASSDGQKSAPSHAQSTPSNDTLEGSRQAGCPSNYYH